MTLLADIEADIEAMVTCESPSSDPVAVARSADLVARIGTQRLGAAPARHGANLLWRWGGEPKVLVLGHHDTVWPLGSLATHPFSVAGGVMRGPGCFDMKAGVAMALHALAALDDLDGVTLLITSDEEIGSPGSRTLIEESAAGCAAALVLEASADGGALKTERKGISMYTVRAHGRAAHAGLEPHRGVNAALELAHQALTVAALADPQRGSTVTPTTFAAGTTSNTVPAGGEFAVDVRTALGDEQDRIDAAMRGLQPVLAGATLEVTGGRNRPPLPGSASAELFARAQRIAAGLGLPPLASAAVGGGSDGNFTAGIGIPTLDGLGAVGGGAHAADEHVLVDRLPDRTALLTALIRDLLG
ncbi:M20/M25/M40 family metallo-hydrolase [Actinoplanes sp. NPDC051633]|uniref:M20/M25/M40 family metallo-hydrolase n=1 Tax=Actinoplanes sp. NPDC051633 TaxID=3155670 RepID=UPI00343A0670